MSSPSEAPTTNRLLDHVHQAGHAVLEELAGRHGPSFHVASPTLLVENLGRLGAALGSQVPHVEVSYSYKTNWLPGLLRAVHRSGHIAEVVSRTELELAHHVGHRGTGIIFNGPAKTAEDVFRALDLGVRLHVDSPVEVDAIERWHAAQPGRCSTLGIRVKGTWAGSASRFGLDPTTSELEEALARLTAIPGAELAGVHIHASGRRSIADVQNRLHQLGQVLDGPLRGRSLRYIDLGGGFSGEMPDELAAQFSESPPSWQQYAAVMGAWFRERWPTGEGPRLVVEPGVAVVADAVVFVCRVESIRRRERGLALVTTGTRLAIRASRSGPNLPTRVVRGSRTGRAGPFVVEGYTCMEDDVLVSALDEEASEGDFVVIGQVGAYSMVFQPPFIRPAPATLAGPREPEPWGVLRRAATLDDWLARSVGERST